MKPYVIQQRIHNWDPWEVFLFHNGPFQAAKSRLVS